MSHGDNPYDVPQNRDPDFDPFAAARPTRVRWTIFALCCGTSWTLYLHRYTFALIKPSLQTEWNLGETELGLLDGAFSLCYALFQVPSGIAADVFGPHLFLGGAILLWSAALGLHAWAPNLLALRIVRAAFGAAQAGVYATLSRITRIWFPAAVRTTMQGWIGVFFGRIGGASANLLFAAFFLGVLALDWRTSVSVFAAGGIVLAVAFIAVFRNAPRQHPWVNDAEAALIEGRAIDEPAPAAAPKKMSLGQLLRGMSVRSIANLLCLNFQTILSTIADNIYSAWIPLFLFQVHSLKFQEMGVFSALPLLGGAAGGAVGGLLNDAAIRASGNRRWSRSLVALTGKGTAGALILAALLLYQRPYLFCTLLFFVKFFGDWSLTTSWGTVTDIGGRATATVFAWNNGIATTGAIAAPVMYGYVVEHFGWPPVFVIVGTTYLLCAASWLLVDCTIAVIRRDA